MLTASRFRAHCTSGLVAHYGGELLLPVRQSRKGVHLMTEQDHVKVAKEAVPYRIVESLLGRIA